MADPGQMPKNVTQSILAQAGDGNLPPGEVDGFVDLSGGEGKSLVFRHLTFKYGFVADFAKITSIMFDGCVFDAPLKIRNASIGGDIVLKKCTLRAPDGSSAKEARLLDLRGTTVHGSVDVRSTQICGACRLDRAVVRGNLRIRDGSQVAATTSLIGAAIDSQVELSGSVFGEIVLGGAKLGSLWIGSRAAVDCAGLYASDMEVRTFARLTRFRARTSLAAGRPGRRLHLEEPGTIAFRSCRFGSLFSTWIVKRFDEEESGWQEDNRVVAEKAFLFTDCKVAGELTLSRLHVGTAEPEPALDARGEPTRPKVEAAAPTEPGAAGDPAPQPGSETEDPAREARIAALPRMPWGHVRLDRTVVEGAFLILSPISVAHRFELSRAARREARKRIFPDPMKPEYRAHMRSLSMRDFKASYVDLSGLSLHACTRRDQDGAIDGCLVGDRLEVKSSVTTYAWLKPEDAAQLGIESPEKLRAYTEVPGAIRLRGARIGELRLAAESFGRGPGSVAHQDGVVLELASIEQLRVPPRGTSPECPHPNAFPVPLDLSGVTVRHWNFNEDVNAEGTGQVDDYLDFLDNDEKLHREVYRSIAASLRNVGRDRDAERILYLEETRARWERHHPGEMWPPYPRAGRRGASPPSFRARASSVGFHPFEWLDRWLLGYRRNPITLLAVMAALFLFSTFFVSSRPANFELSPTARLVLEAQRPGMGDAAGLEAHLSGQRLGPIHWGPAQALWMSARYHIPIIPMVAEDEYVATNDDRLDFGLPWERTRWNSAGYHPGEVWFTAEDWFAIMSLLNWIMWPLLLTFALRRALRAEDPS